MPSFRRLTVAACLFVATATPVMAQQGDAGTLTLERIFNDPALRPSFMGPTKWLADSGAYTALEARQTGGQELVRYDAETGGREVMIPGERFTPEGAASPLEIEDYTFSDDQRSLLLFTNSARVWRQNTRGDFWVLDRASGRLHQLGGDAKPSTLMFAKFSPDGGRVAYVRENNLYVEDLASHAITQLTHDGSRTIINGTFDWVYEEELDLRDGFRWSPDGRRIAYWQLDASGVRDFLLIDNTDSLYSFTIPVQYPKAGQTNSAGRVGVVDAKGGTTTWFNVPGDPRNNYIARMDWAANSNELLLQHLNRLQNTDDVLLADANSGVVRTVLTERDSAWVDVVDDVQWLDKGARFTWVSERDGWRHVYAVSRDGKTVKLLTRGDFDVANVERIDEKGGWLYYIASPDNPTQRYLYRVRLDGSGKAERLTPASEPGTHRYTLAPNAKWALHTWSSFGVPPVTDLVRLPAHTVARTLVDNATLRATVDALRRGKAGFFKVDAGGGVQLDGYLMRPADFDSTKRYPLFFNVYGEPAGQTAVDEWGFSDYLWHLMLTQQGYLVASVDNRGTPSLRGRAWRKSVYRKLGVLTSQDQAGAARTMMQWSFVDPTRVGVWGWSGGGSSTLNLLFRYPDIYRMGIAVAPVPDMRYYDTIYQERYMGLPQDNAADYAQGSPITFAEGLKGKLLLVHGTGDDNVHFQGTEALINALVKADKPFDLMTYPNRSHGIFEGHGTRRHLYELLTRYVQTNL